MPWRACRLSPRHQFPAARAPDGPNPPCLHLSELVAYQDFSFLLDTITKEVPRISTGYSRSLEEPERPPLGSADQTPLNCRFRGRLPAFQSD